MAKSTKVSKKRAVTSKKNTRNTKKGNALAWNSFSKSKIWLFALIFGVVGVLALLQINAKPRVSVADDEILAGYYQSKPTTINRDDAGKITYESYTASYLLLGDGTLLCDDGNAEGTVLTGKLAGGQVKNVTSALTDLDLSTVPYEIAAEKTQEQISNHEGFVFIGNERSYASSVYEGAKKPDKLAKLQEIIQQECNKATRKEERGKTKEFKVPEVKSSSAQQTTVFSKIASALSPKVGATAYAYPTPSYAYPTPTSYAYPTPSYAYPTPTYTYPTPSYTYPTPSYAYPTPASTTLDNTSATNIFNLNNQYRSSLRLVAYKRKPCLDTVARLQAERMYKKGQIYHNPNLVNEIVYVCTSVGDTSVKYWSTLGENVGVGYDSTSLFNAYKASPGHDANLKSKKFQFTGSAAYRTPDGRLWHAQVFGVWPQ